MKTFKMSKKLEELIAKREEALTKQQEKNTNIDALNSSQRVLLDKKSHDLQETINEYAANPSAELEEKLVNLEKEVAQLQLKVAGSQNRSSTVFQAATSEINSLNQQIQSLAKAEYLDFFAKQKAELYEKIGAAKTAYLEALAELYGVKTSVNNDYHAVTGDKAIVSIHEPDFFYAASGYRPLAISDAELKTALKTGAIKDKREYPIN